MQVTCADRETQQISYTIWKGNITSVRSQTDSKDTSARLKNKPPTVKLHKRITIKMTSHWL